MNVATIGGSTLTPRNGPAKAAGSRGAIRERLPRRRERPRLLLLDAVTVPRSTSVPSALARTMKVPFMAVASIVTSTVTSASPEDSGHFIVAFPSVN